MEYSLPKCPVKQFAVAFLDSSSSSDDGEDNTTQKIENYVKNVIRRMKDKQFQDHFRMSKRTFEILMNMSWRTLNKNPGSACGSPEINLQTQLLVTIWYLANLECSRSVSEKFGIAKSTCWNVLQRTWKLLMRMNNDFGIIKWPDEQTQREIAQGFAKNNFNGVIGCIDGSHIRIKRPKNSSNSYVNRKSYHSLLLQGVCDHRLQFTDIYTGEAGSLHDYTLYKRSDLYQELMGGRIQILGDKYLLGDLAYKLSKTLMVRFKDNGFLTYRQKQFNKKLNQIRVKIENTFELLKNRFRRLIFVETRRLDLAVMLIVSSCILHNVCILNEDRLDELQFCDYDENVINETCNSDNDDFEDNTNEITAINLRNSIMDSL